MRLTFKKHKRETGLRGVAEPWPPTDIKADGGIVGRIHPPHWSDKTNDWRISFAVKEPITKEKPAGFRWAKLAYLAKDETDAREFVTKHWDKIVEKYDLYVFD